MRRPLFPIGSVVIAGVVAFACQEPDPNYGDPGGILGKKLPSEPGAATAPGAVDTGPFAGTTPTAPEKTLKAAHAAATPPAPAPEAVPECLGCHGKGAAGATIKWAFAGRVMEGTAGVKDIDVIVLKDAVKVGPVKTDADGFFWAPDTAIPEGAKTHIRKGTTVTSMNGALTAAKGGACNTTPVCHGEGGVGPIHP
jgi:hypothetical protein